MDKMHEWVNWSGSLRFTPARMVEAASEAQLQEILWKAYSAGRKVKVAAAGHSSSPLVKTEETLVQLRDFKKLVAVNRQENTATIQTGMTVHDINSELQRVGLALFNAGDVDVQTLAGAISTGTHGTGKRLQNLASTLLGLRMIDYKGNLKIFTEKQHADIMRAMRVSLGAFGIFTEIEVKTVPLFRLQRIEVCTDIETCMDNFEHLSSENRNVDFYWYPRSDEAKIRILNEPGQGTHQLSFKHRCVEKEEGWVGDVLPRTRHLKFDETEFALPAEKGMKCFEAIRKRIKEKHRRDVAWRVLVRTIASDNNYLSPHYGRESISVSVHHNAGLPFEDFFKDLEPIFIEYEGRPHWAKKHFLRARHLSKLYMEWDNFHKLRKQLDPQGLFMNDHLREIFEE
jgi:FAD/FMN-containing dehydrogenase